jgi:dephospho-CoA kinase
MSDSVSKNRTAIGLTGGIASGKSFVSDCFAQLGAEIIDTDLIAREVLSVGNDALNMVVHAFGERILQHDGSLNRRALREIIFADKGARSTLEAITHPRIRALVKERWQGLSANNHAPYALIVVPLMAEGGRYDYLREVIVVDAAVHTQLQRLMSRDGVTEKLASEMIKSQANRSVRLKLADHVISNDGDRHALEAPIQWLHDRFSQLRV